MLRHTLAVLAVALLLTGCASSGPILNARLAPLRGQPYDVVNADLCEKCDLSHNGRQAKCKVYLEGCGGRNTHMILRFDDNGLLTTWTKDD